MMEPLPAQSSDRSPEVRASAHSYAGRMRAMLIDSHCHLDFPELQADFPGVLERMRANGVTHALTISTTLETFPVGSGPG